MDVFLDFEKPIANLDKKLQDLRALSTQDGMDLSEEIVSLERKVAKLLDETYANLNPWQKVQLCRHPNRPHAGDYIEKLFPTFLELQGDRCYSDDRAIVAGIAEWPEIDSSILIIGQQKGRTTKQKMERNFGMAKPEGYRKVMRLMDLAERMRLPILTLIDTPGAYPGIETEERGQAQAIAECISKGFGLTVPMVGVVIGEGGSGGALALGVANDVLMMEYSTYSVISPEGCASILWSDAKFAERAADCLKLSPQDLMEQGVIDAIIPEPKGGAHRDPDQAIATVGEEILNRFKKYMSTPWNKTHSGKSKAAADKAARGLAEARIEKFRKMGTLALDRVEGATP